MSTPVRDAVRVTPPARVTRVAQARVVIGAMLGMTGGAPVASGATSNDGGATGVEAKSTNWRTGARASFRFRKKPKSASPAR